MASKRSCTCRAEASANRPRFIRYETTFVSSRTSACGMVHRERASVHRSPPQSHRPCLLAKCQRVREHRLQVVHLAISPIPAMSVIPRRIVVCLYLLAADRHPHLVAFFCSSCFAKLNTLFPIKDTGSPIKSGMTEGAKARVLSGVILICPVDGRQYDCSQHDRLTPVRTPFHHSWVCLYVPEVSLSLSRRCMPQQGA